MQNINVLMTTEVAEGKPSSRDISCRHPRKHTHGLLIPYLISIRRHEHPDRLLANDRVVHWHRRRVPAYALAFVWWSV